jgi:hypothetical protein
MFSRAVANSPDTDGIRHSVRDAANALEAWGKTEISGERSGDAETAKCSDGETEMRRYESKLGDQDHDQDYEKGQRTLGNAVAKIGNWEQMKNEPV